VIGYQLICCPGWHGQLGPLQPPPPACACDTVVLFGTVPLRVKLLLVALPVLETVIS
jgi:hypothetical protein